MAVYTRMAVVKLDPADSNSTGGEVIDIVDWFSVKDARGEGNSVPADYSDAAGPYKNPYEGEEGISCIASETAANKVAHAGWNLKTTGSGGRASRVQYECLVALTNSQDA